MGSTHVVWACVAMAKMANPTAEIQFFIVIELLDCDQCDGHATMSFVDSTFVDLI